MVEIVVINQGNRIGRRVVLFFCVKLSANSGQTSNHLLNSWINLGGLHRMTSVKVQTGHLFFRDVRLEELRQT